MKKQINNFAKYLQLAEKFRSKNFANAERRNPMPWAKRIYLCLGVFGIKQQASSIQADEKNICQPHGN